MECIVMWFCSEADVVLHIESAFCGYTSYLCKVRATQEFN